jgi:hypothetical protein
MNMNWNEAILSAVRKDDTQYRHLYKRTRNNSKSFLHPQFYCIDMYTVTNIAEHKMQRCTHGACNKITETQK